jgi:diadenosine tetraphosphate (Ap4A) HIT family hydrolase
MSDSPFVASGRFAPHADHTEPGDHAEPYALGCPFCERHDLELTLATTKHFYVLADHAPLLEGHLLIVPHSHYACYGAVPREYEAEFAAVKRQVARFLTTTYRAPTFFEHGVFRQTVFHAHLHALPFGLIPLHLSQQAEAFGGRPVRSLADLADWYTGRGHYFYLEEASEPAPAGVDATDGQRAFFSDAAVFPPEMSVYSQVVGSLWQLGHGMVAWRSPQERFAQREPMLRGVARAWQAFLAAG